MQSNRSGLRDVSGPRAALAGQPQTRDSTPTRPADEPQAQPQHQQHASTRSRGASNYRTQDDKNINIKRHSGERRGATSSRYSTHQQLNTIKDYKNIKRNVERTGRPHRSWTAVSNNGETTHLKDLKTLDLQALVVATSEQEMFRLQGKMSSLVRLEQLDLQVKEAINRKEEI